MDDSRAELTPEQNRALKKSSAGYWGVQFAACAIMMLIFAAGVVASWGYGIGFSDPDTPAGDGFMSLLCFGLFFAGFLYLLKLGRQSTGLGKLRYSWVIHQTERATVGNFRSASRDLEALALARKAAQGVLSEEELEMLQGMDQKFPVSVASTATQLTLLHRVLRVPEAFAG